MVWYDVADLSSSASIQVDYAGIIAH